MAETKIRTKIILRNDSTEAWSAVQTTAVLKKGEPAVEFLSDGSIKMKIGDGSRTYADLPYVGGAGTKVFEATVDGEETTLEALQRVVGAIRLDAGAIGIVKKYIGNPTGNNEDVDETQDKYEYTGYVYTGTAWAAMDGNYSAENVYFSQDLLTTSAVGNITLTNGQATIAAEGKNLKQVFDTIFVKEKNPAIDQPFVRINLIGSGAKEVGTKFTPKWEVQFNPGKYTYGPATGVTATYLVTDNDADSSTEVTGNFPEMTVQESDKTAYKYQLHVVATHTAGTTPVTNVGNPYPAGTIEAGTKEHDSYSITGFRGWFCGYYNGTQALVDPTTITSAQVRAFGARNGSFVDKDAKTGKYLLKTTKMQQMFFAAPAGKVANVVVANNVNGSPQTVKKATINVEGANGFTAIPYDLFYVNNATAESGESEFAITTVMA